MERVNKLDPVVVAGQDTGMVMCYIDEYTMIGRSPSAAIIRLVSNMSLSGRLGGLPLVCYFGDHAPLPPTGARISQLSPQAGQQREPKQQQPTD